MLLLGASSCWHAVDQLLLIQLEPVHCQPLQIAPRSRLTHELPAQEEEDPTSVEPEVTAPALGA